MNLLTSWQSNSCRDISLTTTNVNHMVVLGFTEVNRFHSLDTNEEHKSEQDVKCSVFLRKKSACSSVNQMAAVTFAGALPSLSKSP